MTKGELYDGIAVILEVDRSSIMDNAELSAFEEWNSLSAISFIAFADEKIGHVVDPKILKNAKTIKDLYEIVRSKIEQ